MTVDKRRTNACLKACEGISTQNLEDNVPVLELARRYNVVLRERDALRAAVQHEADCVDAAKAEIDAMRSKSEAMEKPEPVGTTHAMPGASAFTVACFNASDVPVGTKLYALPGAKGE